MKIFGHPWHVMLIHFPTALFPMDVVCSIVAYNSNDPSFVAASFYAMVGGVLLGVLAIVTGAIDLLAAFRQRPETVNRVLIHGSINGVVVASYFILAVIAWQQYPVLVQDGPGKLILKGCLVSFMFVGNFLGGRLILKDRLAVE
jgi:uncharacterized membrane protein